MRNTNIGGDTPSMMDTHIEGKLGEDRQDTSMMERYISSKKEPVEEFKLTPEFSKWNKNRKKMQKMGVILQGEFLENTRKAQISKQTFMDFSRLWDFHNKVKPTEETQEVPGM